MKNNELKDLVFSENWEERLIGEYIQTKIRYEHLKNLCNTLEVQEMGLIEKVLSKKCPLSLLREQQKYMGMYLGCLEKRLIIYGIRVPEMVLGGTVKDEK